MVLSRPGLEFQICIYRCLIDKKCVAMFFKPQIDIKGKRRIKIIKFRIYIFCRIDNERLSQNIDHKGLDKS